MSDKKTVELERKTFVVYFALHPQSGDFVEAGAVEVSSRDASIEIPEGVVAYAFVDVYQGEVDEAKVGSTPFNESAKTFVVGEELTADELLEELSQHYSADQLDSARAKFQAEGWTRFVKLPNGLSLALGEDDVVESDDE